MVGGRGGGGCLSSPLGNMNSSFAHRRRDAGQAEPELSAPVRIRMISGALQSAQAHVCAWSGTVLVVPTLDFSPF